MSPVCLNVNRGCGVVGWGRGGGMHTYNNNDTRRERGWVAGSNMCTRGEEKEDHVFKKKGPKSSFSFTRIDYGHPLSLFLIPILCIDKLSNPHPFKSISSFPLLLFSFLQRLVGGWWDFKGEERKDSIEDSRLNTLNSFIHE